MDGPSISSRSTRLLSLFSLSWTFPSLVPFSPFLPFLPSDPFELIGKIHLIDEFGPLGISLSPGALRDFSRPGFVFQDRLFFSGSFFFCFFFDLRLG